MNYYDLVTICQGISNKLDSLLNLLNEVLYPILYLIGFYILLKIGFTCLRGYKV